MKIFYVTHIYEVRVPDDRTEVDASIDQVHSHPDDASIVKSSDEAVAMHMSYAFNRGKLQEHVGYFDSYVRDVPPDVEEFEET